MGTRVSVVLPAGRARAQDETLEAIEAIVEACEARLSVHRSTSAFSILNAEGEAALEAREVQLLKTCRAWFERLDGAFDPALGSGFESLVLERRRARWTRAGARLDLGGVGKGYCLDRIRAALVDRRVEHAFVSLGESSILGLGRPPDGPSWSIGLTNPCFEPDGRNIIKRLNLTNACLSVSNTVRGGRWGTDDAEAHVVDPRTGAPIVGERMVAVVADSGVIAEIISTAALVMPREVLAASLDPELDCAIFEAEAVDGQIRCYELF